MVIHRIIWSVLISLMLVSSCWSSVESADQKAVRNARDNINRLYFDYVFAEENERLLRAIMVSVRRIYDRYELDHWLTADSGSGNQTEVRQQLLTRLVQQATRHTIANVMASDEPDGSDRSMFHLLQALSTAPAMHESRDVAHWSQTRPVMLQGVVAEDRMDSMEELIQEAVQNSFREFPSNRLSREQLARQLSFILLEMQERFLRGKALRSLSFKVDKQKENPQIAGDPAFHLYLSLLTETFNRHPTLWHTGSSERRHYQEDLSALFMKAADREDYGKEWYQQIRRILDGEKPVPVTPPPPAQETVRYHYEDDDEYEGWFELTTFRVMLGMGAMVGVFAASIVYQVISEHEAESQRQQSQQEEELKKQLGKKLNKPERKDPKGRDWQPSIKDKEEVKLIMESFPEKVWKNVMIQAGLVSPLLCKIDLEDILMQLQLSALYSHLREARFIWTEEDEIQHKRQQEEYAKRHKKEQEEAAKRARTVTHTSSTTHQKDDWGGLFSSGSSLTYNFSSSEDGSGSTSFGTATTTEVQGRDAGWN